MTDLAFIAPLSPMPIRRRLPALAAAAAVLVSGLAATGAKAATTCTNSAGLLEVRMSAHNDYAHLYNADDGIGVEGNDGGVRCAGDVPLRQTIDLVLIVDESDNLATAAGNDGNTRVEISSPYTFAPGKTRESGGQSEIEFLADTKAGRDQLVLGPNGENNVLTVGNGGAAWTTDSDADLSGMPFDDVFLNGEAGADYLSAQGGLGTGAALSSAAYVELNGDGGDDFLFGSDVAAGDRIVAGAGNDTAQGGGGGADTIAFTDAPNGVAVDLANSGVQDTGEGSDTLSEFERATGSPHADRLTGTDGANALIGGQGDDVLEGRGGADELQGDEGSDTVSYAGAPAAVNIDLARTTQATDADKFFSVENLTGSPFGDTLLGNAVANRIDAGAGPDTVAAGDGADLLQLRDGEGDRAACGAGADTALSDRRSLDTVEADCETVDALPEPQPGGAGEQPGGGQTPDTTLQFTLAGAKRQRLVRQRAIRLRMQCPLEDCTAVATASGRVRGTRLRLRPRTLSVSDGPARTVELRLTRKLRRALRAALAAGTRPRLTVTARARDAAGNSVRKSLRVTAKRAPRGALEAGGAGPTPAPPSGGGGGASAPRGRGRGLAAGVHIQLLEDRRHVVIHGPLGHEQSLSDLAVSEAFAHQRKHLDLPRREPGRVLPRGRTWPARERTGTALAQLPRDDGRRGPGAQSLERLMGASHHPLVVGARKRERRLVGTAKLGPQV